MSEPEIVVVRVDDVRCAELEDAGWTRVAESWGARLRVNAEANLEPARRALAALPAELTICELSPDSAQKVHAFDVLTRPDYPVTPQNAPPERDIDDVRELWQRGGRVFAALRGEELLGLTVIDRAEGHGEIDFLAVDRSVRRQGVGAAVIAAAVLTLAAEGVRTFGSGGAEVNEGSRRTAESLGFVIEERWVSLQEPQ